MRQLFRQDVEFWASVNSGRDKQNLTSLEILALFFKHIPIRAVFWFRFSQYLSAKRVPLVAGYIRRMMLRNFGLDLPPDTEIAGGLYIPHTVGVTILARSIGARCSIIGNVTLGKRIGDSGPLIGDDVYIGAGARIIGPVTIGDRAKIGANAVVVRDVPEDATVVGIPGRVIDTGSGQI